MSRRQKQLEGIAVTFEIFDSAGLMRDDGQPIKDLRDFLRIDMDQWENDKNINSPLTNFLSYSFYKKDYNVSDDIDLKKQKIFKNILPIILLPGKINLTMVEMTPFEGLGKSKTTPSIIWLMTKIKVKE
jgi:hypothetical protein